MTDDRLDELYDLLFLGPDGPLVGARMALKPDPAASSHFIPAPRPILMREEMARIGEEGLIAEVGRVLDDLPPAHRQEVLDRIAAIAEALRAQTADDSNAEPPSLIYALH